MKKPYILAFLAIALSFSANAQKLDPTVNVSRSYQGKLMEAEKPDFEMEVPDSVTKFNVQYDYSVFKTQYKGAYEFNPYLLDMKPEKDAYSGKSLFVRAGVGYALHPLGDVVWTPNFKSPGFSMNLYGSHRSYIGKYRSVFSREEFNGLDMTNMGGICGRADWKKGFFTFDADYDGIITDSPMSKRGWNNGELKIRFSSKPSEGPYFLYDLAFEGSYGQDVSSGTMMLKSETLNQTGMKFDASLGSIYKEGRGILLDLDADMAFYSGVLGYNVGDLSLTPKYVFKNSRFDIDAGVRFSYLMTPGGTEFPNSQTKSRIFYPAVKVDFIAIKNALDIYARVGGGNDINSHSRLIHSNHFINSAYGVGNVPEAAFYMDNTVENLNAVLGFRGNISKRFMFDLSGGYRIFSNRPFYSYQLVGLEFLPSIVYGAVNEAFAKFDFGVKTADVDVNGNFTYTHTAFSQAGFYCFKPSEFSGSLDVTYNWNRRIFASVRAEGATKQLHTSLAENAPSCLPGYVDLGINGEYRINTKWAIWLEANNLLNMEIHRNPFYAQSGIWFTAGATLNL